LSIKSNTFLGSQMLKRVLHFEILFLGISWNTTFSSKHFSKINNHHSDIVSWPFGEGFFSQIFCSWKLRLWASKWNEMTSDKWNSIFIRKYVPQPIRCLKGIQKGIIFVQISLKKLIVTKIANSGLRWGSLLNWKLNTSGSDTTTFLSFNG